MANPVAQLGAQTLFVVGGFGRIARFALDVVAAMLRPPPRLQRTLNELYDVGFLSLALIVTGVGFLKTNISTVVGLLYRKNDPRRDGGPPRDRCGPGRAGPGTRTRPWILRSGRPRKASPRHPVPAARPTRPAAC